MIFSFCVNFSFDRIGIYSYISDMTTPSTIFEKYYVDSANVKFQFPKQKRNLIYIYLESMETTYESKELGGAMDVNLIPELSQIASENITFNANDVENNGFYVPEGTGWTIGAMVAHSAGIPLKIPIDGNMYDSGPFLPGATTIGQILAEAGYNQELFIGSDAKFGGRENFYEQHGNYKIADYYYAIDNEFISKDYYEWWGFEDEKLYDFAKPQLLELASENKPFNFTMLTTDTHHFDGYLCPKCPSTYESQYANVIACASAQVSEFLDWIKEQDFYEDTTIIIAGDHLSMDPNFFQSVSENYQRKGYFTIINAGTPLTNTQSKKFTTFDLFPTTLASLGIQFDSNRLGLGTNLFSNDKTVLEELGWEELQNQLNMYSKFYNNKILYND